MRSVDKLFNFVRGGIICDLCGGCRNHECSGDNFCKKLCLDCGDFYCTDCGGCRNLKCSNKEARCDCYGICAVCDEANLCCGKVDTSDALEVLRAAVGLVKLDPIQVFVANTRRDGTVNTNDALQILRFAVGLINKI